MFDRVVKGHGTVKRPPPLSIKNYMNVRKRLRVRLSIQPLYEFFKM